MELKRPPSDHFSKLQVYLKDLSPLFIANNLNRTQGWCRQLVAFNAVAMMPLERELRK